MSNITEAIICLRLAVTSSELYGRRQTVHTEVVDYPSLVGSIDHIDKYAIVLINTQGLVRNVLCHIFCYTTTDRINEY